MNPLNVITEETRAALEAELEAPVFTGMKHWTPSIADAAEQAGETGRRPLVGLVLAPHYSACRSPATGTSSSTRSMAGQSSCSSRAGTTTPASLGCLPSDSRDGSARRVHRPLAPCANPRRRRSVRGPAPRDLAARRRGGGRRGLVVLVPVASPRRASPGSSPTSSTTLRRCTARESSAVLVCPVGFVSDHLEIRWDLDVEAAERAAELGLAFDRIEMPNADPAFVARARRRSFAGRPRYRLRRDVT